MIQIEYLTQTNREELKKYRDNTIKLNNNNENTNAHIIISFILLLASIAAYGIPTILNLKFFPDVFFLLIYSFVFLALAFIGPVISKIILSQMAKVYDKKILLDVEELSSNSTVLEENVEKEEINEIHTKTVQLENEMKFFSKPLLILKIVYILGDILGLIFLIGFLVTNFLHIDNAYINYLNIFHIY